MYVSVGKIHDFLSKGSRSDERKTTRSQKGTICVVLLNAFNVIEFHYNILIVIHRKVFESLMNVLVTHKESVLTYERASFSTTVQEVLRII